MADLFSPLQAGALHLQNRIIMAPLTRARAGESRLPNDLMATYYAQRASAGLIITEATAIDPMGYGWHGAPALYTDAQQNAWRMVTDAVHQAGGKIICQLWHMGRVSHPDFLDGALPLAPSAIAASGECHTPNGKKPRVTPRTMTQNDIDDAIAAFAAGARRAIAAGFDGVQIHGANGYLIDQFLKSSSNQRTDAYGGSIANRARFLQQVTAAVCDAIGADRTALRLSALNGYNDMVDDDLAGLFAHVAEVLNPLGLAFLELREPAPLVVTPIMRKIYHGVLVGNDGYDRARAMAAIANGDVDAVAFGQPYIANPDLVERLQRNAALNELDPATSYGNTPAGYTDYPFLEPSRAA